MAPKKTNGWSQEKEYVLAEIRGMRADFSAFMTDHAKLHQSISRWQGWVDGKLGIWALVVSAIATAITLWAK
jgi:hypothetical protein